MHSSTPPHTRHIVHILGVKYIGFYSTLFKTKKRWETLNVVALVITLPSFCASSSVLTHILAWPKAYQKKTERVYYAAWQALTGVSKKGSFTHTKKYKAWLGFLGSHAEKYKALQTLKTKYAGIHLFLFAPVQSHLIRPW